MDASFHELDDTKARALHLLTCPLCTKQYEDPRVLPCQHTFCCRCLLGHVDRVQSSRPGSARLGAFPCPICVAAVGLPSAGVSAFPVDERIRNIRDLVVQEMAKDLASRFGRQHSDDDASTSSHSPDVPSRRRGAGVSSATRLDDIREQTGVAGDDDVDYGTSPSSSRLHQFTDESSFRSTPPWSTDEPTFSRQKPGYSSLRGVKSTRRSRPTDRLPTTSESATSFSGTGTPESGFSRNMPGYCSLRESRLRRGRAGDGGSSQPMSDGMGRPDGPTIKSSSSFTNGYPSPHSPEPSRKGFQRTSSHVEVTSKSSPFDNINRDDDLSSEPYTPKIGRNRLAYSSLRERRRRPLFDNSRFSDELADFMDEEPSAAFGYGNDEDRLPSNRHSYSSIRSQTLDAFEPYESHRTPFRDDNWTQGSFEQKLRHDNHVHESDEIRGTGRNITSEKPRRPRPASLDPSSLTVLSHFVAGMNSTAGHSKVYESATEQNYSPSQRLRDDDEGGHQLNASSIGMSTNCQSRDEVLSVSEKNSASQPNGCCDVQSNEADNVSSKKYSKPIASCSADSEPPCSPDMSQSVTASQSPGTAEFVDGATSSPLEEGRHSPVRSPNESHFSRLTKFRTAKNSKASKLSPSSTSSSISESTSRDAVVAESVSSETDEVPVAKPRYRKRPPMFVGTPFSFAAARSSASGHSSPDIDGKEEVNGGLNAEREVHDAEVSSISDEKDEGQTASVPAVDMTANVQTDAEPCSSDASPTTEQSAGVDFERHDQSESAVDTSHQRTVESVQDDDSAVYSADVDSDVTVRSAATDQYLPTPVSDDTDDDEENLRSASDAATSASPSEVQDRPNDVIRCRLDEDDDEGGGSTWTEVRVHVENDATDEADRSSTDSDADERRQQTGGQAQSDDDVNEDDAAADPRMDSKQDRDVESGYRRSSGNHVSGDDDNTTSSRPSEGYVLATGVAALNDSSLVVADYGAGCVCISDDDGRTEHRVAGLKPFSIATSSTSSVIGDDDDQLIYIGDRRRKTLLVLDRHGADVAQWPDNQFDWVCGIACLPDGQLAVIDRSRTRQLVIYSASGGGSDEVRPVAEFGGHGSALGDLCMAEFVAADSRGRLLVADSANHCVKAFDRRVAAPGVVAVYGTERGSGDAQLEWPKGVAVDAADNVLVADCRNSRVVAFSVDGRALGAVVPAVRGPFAVCALPTSPARVAVTTYSVCGLSEFAVYEYDSMLLPVSVV